ncbi:MAG: hypothetical protein MI747_14145 [Desulfobacterales bacterium]|nr:hypothetical protein [Desulfobacterales bacterium]
MEKRKINILIGIFALCLATISWSAFAGDDLDIPEIAVPSNPGVAIQDPAIMWDHRYQYMGKITSFADGKIWIKGRGFDKNGAIRYFGWRGETIFFSSLNIGMEVGVVLNPKLEILEVWKIPPS